MRTVLPGRGQLAECRDSQSPSSGRARALRSVACERKGASPPVLACESGRAQALRSVACERKGASPPVRSMRAEGRKPLQWTNRTACAVPLQWTNRTACAVPLHAFTRRCDSQPTTAPAGRAGRWRHACDHQPQVLVRWGGRHDECGKAESCHPKKEAGSW